MNFVKHLDRNGFCFKVHVETRNILLSNLLQCFDFKSVGQGLLDGHLILTRELHQENVNDIEDDEDKSLEELDLVSHQEIRNNGQVDEDEDGFTSDDPPINQRASIHN